MKSVDALAKVRQRRVPKSDSSRLALSPQNRRTPRVSHSLETLDEVKEGLVARRRLPPTGPQAVLIRRVTVRQLLEVHDGHDEELLECATVSSEVLKLYG